MNETSFHERADEILTSVFEAIEAVADDKVETDMIDGILTIELEDGSEFVVNKHEPTRQLWFSSPESGAHHYEYDDSDDEWYCTKEGDSFKEVITHELSKLAGIHIEC